MIKYYPSKKHVSYLIIMACVIFSGLSGAATQKRWMPYISWLRPKDALRVTAQGWVSRYKMQHFATISREWEGHTQPKLPEVEPPVVIDVPTVFVSKRSMLYHVAGCPLILPNMEFTEVPFYEAMNGMKLPCSKCKPIENLWNQP